MSEIIIYSNEMKINNIYTNSYKPFLFLIIFLYSTIEYRLYLGKSFNHYFILDYPEVSIDLYKNIFDLLNKKNTLDILRKETKIENIFVLITIFPFLRKKIILTKKNSIYKLYNHLLNFNNKRIIEIKKEQILNFSLKFKDLLYYKWELLPNKNITNYIRHILYHYYSEECLDIYDKSLNLNFKYFINDNKKQQSNEFISDLMSKISYNIIYIRKYWNI